MEDFLIKFASNFGFAGIFLLIFYLLEVKKGTISNLFGKKELILLINTIKDTLLKYEKDLINLSNKINEEIKSQNEFLKNMFDFISEYQKKVDNKLNEIDNFSQQTKTILNDNVNQVNRMIDNIHFRIKKLSRENNFLKYNLIKKIVIYIGYKIKVFCIEQNKKINQELFTQQKEDSLKLLIQTSIKEKVKERLMNLIEIQEKQNDEDLVIPKEICLRIKEIAIKSSFFDYHFNRLIDNFYVKTNGDEQQIYRKNEGFKNIIKLYIEELFDKLDKSNIFCNQENQEYIK